MKEKLQRCSQGQRATLVTRCRLTCQRWTDWNGGQRSTDIATLHVFILATFSKITRSMIFHLLANMFIYVLNLKISLSSVFLNSCCTRWSRSTARGAGPNPYSTCTFHRSSSSNSALRLWSGQVLQRFWNMREFFFRLGSGLTFFF